MGITTGYFWPRALRTALVLIVVAFVSVTFWNIFSYVQLDVRRTVRESSMSPSGEQAASLYEERQNGCQPSVISFLEKPKPFVALASFPGSGNTWARELLEGLTGIYSGSVYIDLMANHIGSKRCPWLGEVYIIKTHKMSTRVTHPYCEEEIQSDKHFEKCIFVLRNPYDALIAEFNRQHSGKVGVANQSKFTSNKFKRFVQSSIVNWGMMVRYWANIFQKPSQILVYERLQNDTFNELINVASFLQIEVTNTTLHCVLETYKPQYKRIGKPKWLNKETLFNSTLRYIVNNEIDRVLNDVAYNKYLRHTIENYLLT